MSGECRVREAARANHGLIARQTAVEAGLSDDAIQHQVRLGRWETVHAGVYYLNVTPRTWLTDVLAAVLAAGNLAFVSHRTAGRLWNLDGVGSRIIELTVPHDDRPLPVGVMVHRTRRSLAADTAQGIPTTTPERTLQDLAGILPMAILEKAYMSALHQGHTTADRMVDQLESQGGRGVKGTRKLRKVIPLAADGKTGSASEVELRQLIRQAPVPAPVHQLRIPLPTGSNAFPDFSWPDRMKIVEVDGYDSHSTPEQLNADLIRQNMLMDLGWQIRRFTGRRIRREPKAVIQETTHFVLGLSG